MNKIHIIITSLFLLLSLSSYSSEMKINNGLVYFDNFGAYKKWWVKGNLEIFRFTDQSVEIQFENMVLDGTPTYGLTNYAIHIKSSENGIDVFGNTQVSDLLFKIQRNKISSFGNQTFMFSPEISIVRSSNFGFYNSYTPPGKYIVGLYLENAGGNLGARILGINIEVTSDHKIIIPLLDEINKSNKKTIVIQQNPLRKKSKSPETILTPTPEEQSVVQVPPPESTPTPSVTYNTSVQQQEIPETVKTLIQDIIKGIKDVSMKPDAKLEDYQPYFEDIEDARRLWLDSRMWVGVGDKINKVTDNGKIVGKEEDSLVYSYDLVIVNIGRHPAIDGYRADVLLKCRITFKNTYGLYTKEIRYYFQHDKVWGSHYKIAQFQKL